MNFLEGSIGEQLLEQSFRLKQSSILNCFNLDHHRFDNFSIKIPELDLLVDFSKQHIDLTALNMLYQAAAAVGLSAKIQDLFNGVKLNLTEHRSVGHMKLREPGLVNFTAKYLPKINNLLYNIYSNNIKDLICVGIGGSELGPKMVCNALDPYTIKEASNIKFHFIANQDLNTISKVLSKIDPISTMLLVSSKSFTTAETLNNANFIQEWLLSKLGVQALSRIIAITSNVQQAARSGILADNIFAFDDNIGGRYSVWSPVGLPILIKIGIENFNKFLQGAYLIDQNFQNNDWHNNIAINLGLISLWNINFMQYHNLAIIPYSDLLVGLPEYLQQLSMESNGKSIDLNQQKINYNIAEIIFGGVGCNVQHSFMQMLHQGTQIVPVDFIVSLDQPILLANCLAQSQALMQGTAVATTASAQEQPNLEIFKICPGNRPSTTILFKTLTPQVMGALIALYEHKVFVQSIMWNINAFDQWGVELGKTLANTILDQIKAQRSSLTAAIYGSTNGLLKEYFLK